MNLLLARLARQKILCCISAGVLVLVLRAALLPVWPMPLPAIYDEFAYLLQADTFAHGRLTNPPHPMWQFFETIYVLQQPTYAAKYPPAQGLAMAVGQLTFGHPWFGVWLSCGLLAAAFCWALQAWLPPRWALLGVAFSLQVCFFSYWMNSYWGGSVAAFGGALVIGAWPGMVRQRRSLNQRRTYGWILGTGAVIVMLARPYEGLLLVTPVLATLFARTRKVPAAILVCGAVGATWLGFYNYRVTGNALRMPYFEYQAQYETVPQFNILPLAKGKKNYPHTDLEWVDGGWLLNAYRKARSPQFAVMRAKDWYLTLKTILGSALPIIPLLVFAPRLWRRRQTRLLANLAIIAFAGSLIVVVQYPHYMAPFAAVFLILFVRSLRYVRPLVPVFAVLTLGWTIWTDASAIVRGTTPDRFLAVVWKKGNIERDMEMKAPFQHVVLVRYTQYKEPHEEWIYNSADIDAQSVIWAQDMGDEANRRLMEYYPGRKFWLFKPDEDSNAFIPYGEPTKQ